MRLSIALATYNGDKFIQSQLNSILKQTRLPDELVIVDDASTDKTISIINKFKKKVPFSCSIFKNTLNKGSAYTFNKAINLCRFDIIVFCDQDDIWELNKLKKIEDTFIENPNIDYVISNANIIDQNSNDMGYSLWEQRKFNAFWINEFNSGNEFEVLFTKNIITGMTTAISQKIKRLGDVKPNGVIHDAWYIYVASILGYKGKLIEEMLINYRQHLNQQFGSLKDGKLINIENSLKKNKKVIDMNLKILYPLFNFANNNIKESDKKKYEFLLNKLNHFSCRKNIYESNLLSRIFKISKELSSGNYQKYSSAKNIFLDFLSPIISK